jgi:Brp/Blh family beta-carotene 15,15'-monooxygenase
MKNARRSFSNAFLIVTLLVSAAVLLGLHPDPTVGLVVLVASVILLGLPHGALDPMVGQSVFPGYRRAAFYLLYVSAAALVVVAWIAWPKAALGCFLLVAAFHFGSDLEGESRVWLRICYGLTIVTLPCVRYGADVATIYRMLALQPAGDYVAWSPWIAYAAGATTLIAVSLKAKSDLRRVAEVAVILLSGVCLPPLLFFSCYFGLLHSPRHLLETASSLGLKTLRSLFATTAPIVFATLCLAGIGWGVMHRYSGQQRVLLIVFVGLAALTVPHMLLEVCARYMPALRFALGRLGSSPSQ